MPNEAYYLDITLLGKEYRVACPPEEHAALLAAVAVLVGMVGAGVFVGEIRGAVVATVIAMPLPGCSARRRAK